MSGDIPVEYFTAGAFFVASLFIPRVTAATAVVFVILGTLGRWVAPLGCEYETVLGTLLRGLLVCCLPTTIGLVVRTAFAYFVRLGR